MKNQLYNAIYIIYRYYRFKQTTTAAYLSALCLLVFLIFINYLTLSIVFFKKFILLATVPSGSGIREYLITGSVFLLMLIILTLVFKKEKVVNVTLTEENIKKGNKIVLGYFVFSLLGLMFVILRDGNLLVFN